MSPRLLPVRQWLWPKHSNWSTRLCRQWRAKEPAPRGSIPSNRAAAAQAICALTNEQKAALGWLLRPREIRAAIGQKFAFAPRRVPHLEHWSILDRYTLHSPARQRGLDPSPLLILQVHVRARCAPLVLFIAWQVQRRCDWETTRALADFPDDVRLEHLTEARFPSPFR